MYLTVYANSKGEVFEHPDWGLAGRAGGVFREPLAEEMIPLPKGATLTLIPGGVPVGIGPDGRFSLVREKEPVFAVGALLPQGYTRTLLPAYRRHEDIPLPLLGYTAVGWKKGRFYAAGIKTDREHKWNPLKYNTPELPGLISKKIKEFKGNRIIDHLAKCALEYCCLTAQNIFYGRWEGGIPVSPACNAMCLGCISEQPAECCPSPQERIKFSPTVKEVAEIAVSHLKNSDDAIISFGQGCEGEPSLAADTVAAAIKETRAATGRGTININTNAGFTEGIRKICDAGLDSMRVSIISADTANYTAYHRPGNYTLENVIESVKYAKSKRVYVSLNLLVYPGFTDTRGQRKKLLDFIDETGIDMIQLRNLNIDPDFFERQIGVGTPEQLGIGKMLQWLKSARPHITIGNFSRPVKK